MGDDPQGLLVDVALHRRVARPSLGEEDGARAAGRAEGELERPRVLVERVRRQACDPVGRERPPEIHRLAPGTHEAELAQRRIRIVDPRRTPQRRNAPRFTSSAPRNATPAS